MSAILDCSTFPSVSEKWLSVDSPTIVSPGDFNTGDFNTGDFNTGNGNISSS